MNEKIYSFIKGIWDILGYDLCKEHVEVLWDGQKKLIEYKKENEINIKKSIMESDKLTLQQKITLNAVLDKKLKRFQKEMEVLGIAINCLDEKADVKNLDEEWLLDFFDKASKISEEKIDVIWGKLLSYAASDKSICSKLLLNALFLMGTEETADFLTICQHTLSEMYTEISEKEVSAYPIIFYSKHTDTYNQHGISSMRLHKLEMLGLIEVDYKKELVFKKKKMKLIYQNRKIDVIGNKKIKIGNVRFTYEGFLLYKMTEKIYDTNVLDFIVEVWNRRNYEVYINDKLL